MWLPVRSRAWILAEKSAAGQEISAATLLAAANDNAGLPVRAASGASNGYVDCLPTVLAISWSKSANAATQETYEGGHRDDCNTDGS